MHMFMSINNQWACSLAQWSDRRKLTVSVQFISVTSLRTCLKWRRSIINVDRKCESQDAKGTDNETSQDGRGSLGLLRWRIGWNYFFLARAGQSFCWKKQSLLASQNTFCGTTLYKAREKVFSLFLFFNLISFLVKWLGHLSWISLLHYGRVQILGLPSQSVT